MMGKPPFRHLLDILRRREYGFYDPFPQNSCSAMMRSIYKDKENNFFDCIHQESSSKIIYMIENRLYFDNLSVCKTFYGHEKPQLQYQQANFEILNSKMIADFTAINAVGLENSPIPKKEYHNVFYILNKQSMLCLQDMNTGIKMREVFLANSLLCKFKNISFHDELNRMYIISICNPRKTNNPEVIYSVVAFQIFPLQLLGFVEFTNTFFGSGHRGGKLKEIDFQEDILITYHGSDREKLQIFIYDFNQILCPESKLFDAQLDTYCTQIGGVVGKSQVGIPVNYQIKHLPPPLLVIDRSAENIQFSPLPMLHIFGKEKGVIEVYDTASQNLIGKIGDTMDLKERYLNAEDYFVFMDSHDRVLYKNSERILVYKIRKFFEHTDKGDVPRKELALDFELKLPKNVDKMKDSQGKNNPEEYWPKRVMPARKSKTNKRFSLCDNTKICAMSYCDILEMFVVLADIPSYAGTATVLLYDAYDGQMMLYFHTPFTITENIYFDIRIYYDYIFILEQTTISTAKFRIFVFQLSRDTELIDIEG